MAVPAVPTPVTTLTEPWLRTGEYIVGEEEDYSSREQVVVTGGNYWPGTVLGKITTSGKYTALAPAQTDGSQTAAAILYDKALAASVDQKKTVHVRDCTVNGLKLVWPTGITVNQQNAAIAQLNAQFVIVRT